MDAKEGWSRSCQQGRGASVGLVWACVELVNKQKAHDTSWSPPVPTDAPGVSTLTHTARPGKTPLWPLRSGHWRLVV